MTSRILFLHHNFPAQFRHLAQHVAGLHHDVLFLSERNLVGQLPGVRQRTLPGSSRLKHTSLNGQLACAERFRQALLSLRDEGWHPDVIVSHSGWGCGLHSGCVFPQARRISYLEWWFADAAADYDFDPHNPWWGYSEGNRVALRQRNLSLALELVEADAVVTPTQWQRKQLPASLQQRCDVIHEGVDTTFFVSNHTWRQPHRLRLTYATRGLEPMRGFPEFVQALPCLLQSLPTLEVVIAGDDRVAYGAKTPPEGSYGRWATSLLRDWIDHKRVRFVGHLPLIQYARLLKSSDVHCYLSRPFVASWSLLEAMASGCCLVASDIEAVRELADAEATLWTDHRDAGTLQASLAAALALDGEERLHRGQLQRQRAEQHWSRPQSLTQWMGLLGI